MKLRNAALIIASVAVLTAILVNQKVLNQLEAFAAERTPSFWLLVVTAVAVQIAGHWLRMLRTKIILDGARIGSSKSQFGALAIGYLANAIVPFRIGELVRSLLIANRLRVSFLYTFTVVMFERAIDLILIVALAFAFLPIGIRFSQPLITTMTTALFLAVGVLIICWLLANENPYLITLIRRTSSWFNQQVQNRVRFKVWSLIFGLQKFFRDRIKVTHYAAYTLVSWICYLFSVGLLANAATQDLPSPTATVGPYVAITGPLTTNLPSRFQEALTSVTSVTNSELGLLTWLLLSIPMFLVGLGALWTLRSIDFHRPQTTSAASLTNKLARDEDISQEFPGFLDAYFKGNELSRILHQMELSGELSLVKFFKGGSNAVTMLGLSKDSSLVKKLVPAKYEHRLKNQFDWLLARDSQYIVKALGEERGEGYYAINIEHRPDNVSLFEFIHSRPTKEAIRVIESVWEYMFGSIYQLEAERHQPAKRDLYIQERLVRNVQQAAKINDELARVLKAKKIIINGEEYDNFNQIMQKIKKNPRAWRDLATFRSSSVVHGDLTIDNILVDTNTGQPVLIDPSDDNQLSGPIIDFGRHLQSLVYGYEFLCADDEAVTAKSGKHPAINFTEHRSAKYAELAKHVQEALVPHYLTDSERRSIMFHIGLFYGRMLAHRVVINPKNVLKFFAISVRALNLFLRQYDEIPIQKTTR